MTLSVLDTFPFRMFTQCTVSYKRGSVKCLQACHNMREVFFQDVKERMSTGRAALCFVADSFGCEDDTFTAAIKETTSTTLALTGTDGVSGNASSVAIVVLGVQRLCSVLLVL
ncbi:hypothetical protein M405DRAFT_812973 [Rhizopogon salebrosus TDB-379]|nr:hypothetical protein M405DRAFT_812973 [Rhizopogon salebrosus TDB-379]